MENAKQAPGIRRQEVPPLTGLRFVAAFSVLVAHGVTILLANYETPLGVIYWLKQGSGFGMTLFFVLSGFVIHYNYSTLLKTKGLRGVATYLWARFARLYPLFILMLVVTVLLSSRHLDLWTGHPERFESTLLALPYFVLSIQTWFYVPIQESSLIGAIGGGSPITWSISTEWFFYFSYPFMAWFILRTRESRTTIALLVLWCVAWIVLATHLYDASSEMDEWAVERFGPIAGLQDHQPDSFVRWLLYFSPYVRIGEFVLGAFVAQLYVQLCRRKVTKLENLIGACGFLAAVLSVFYVTYLMYAPNIGMNIFRKMNMNFGLAPACAVLIFCAARYDGLANRILQSGPVITLGEASYSIYLVHQVAFLIVARLVVEGRHGLGFDIMILVLTIGAIFVISLISYSFYEAPARKWLRAQWAVGTRSLD